MSRPIVIAHHLIWTVYGYWLPNDPRGSSSQTIRNNIINDLGDLHHGRKKVQPASSEISKFYREAVSVLQHELLLLDKNDVSAIAESFTTTIQNERYTCWACAIMPDHIHLLIRKHKHQAEQMIENFQSLSRSRLRDLNLRKQTHLLWGGPGWKVFQDHPDDVKRTINYIEQNPIKIGLLPQNWDFVTEYNNWPLHPGHSLNSPYVRRMKR